MFRGMSTPECLWSWYDPMQEAKTAYLEFAGIGKKLWSGSGVETSIEIQQQILDFIKKYGPISISKRFELKASPEGLPLIPKEGITFSLSAAAIQAEGLAWALSCYQAIEDPRECDSAFIAAWVEGKMELVLSVISQAHAYAWGSPPYPADLDPKLPESLEYCLYTFMNHSGMEETSPGIYFTESGCWEKAY